MVRNFIDMVLLPQEVFRRISQRLGAFVFTGIFIIGLFDMVLPIKDFLAKYVYGKPQNILLQNIIIILLLSGAIGLIDVFAFVVPVNLYIRRLGFPQEGKDSSALFTRAMKVYVYSHIPIILIDLFLDGIFMIKSYDNSTYVLILFLVTLTWFSMIISKGMNIVYGTKGFARVLVFSAILIWGYLLSWVFAETIKFPLMLLS